MYLYISNIDRFSLQKGKNYYPQVFLEKYKYVVKEFSSDEKNSDDSDEDYSDEKVLMKKTKYTNLFLEKNKKFLFLGLRNVRKNILEKI